IGLALASTLLLSSAVNPSILAKAEAQQSEQDSLPPEIVPSNSAYASSASSAPGLVSNQAEANQPAGQIQSAQDFRKALMDSLAGKGTYRKFNGRNPYGNQFAQNNNQFAPRGQPMGNQSFANQGQPPLGQSDWMTPTQDNTMANANPPQTQTLSGPVSTP